MENNPFVTSYILYTTNAMMQSFQQLSYFHHLILRLDKEQNAYNLIICSEQH